MSHNCHVKNTAEVRRGCQMSIGEADCRIGMQEAVSSSGQRARRDSDCQRKMSSSAKLVLDLECN